MRDYNSSIPFKEKEEKNIWDSIQDFLDILNDKDWKWTKNPKYKYVNLRIDMRDGGCIFMDDDRKRVDPSEIKYQYGKDRK